MSATGGVRFSAAPDPGGGRRRPRRSPAELAPPGRRGARAAAARGRPDGAPPEGFATEVVLPLRAGARAVRRGRPRRRSRASCCSRCPACASVEVVRRRRSRARWRSSGPTAAGPRSPTAGGPTVWAGGAAVRRAARRAGRRPAGGGAGAARLDGDLGGAAGRATAGPRPLPAGQVVHAPTPSDEPLSAARAADRALPARPRPAARGTRPGHRRAGRGRRGHLRRPARRAAGRSGPARPRAPGRAGRGGPRRRARARPCSTGCGPSPGCPSPARTGVRQAARAGRGAGRRDRRAGGGAGRRPAGAAARRLVPAHRTAPALAALGVRRIGIAEAVEAVRGVQRPPSWWGAALRRARRRRPRGARRAARPARRRPHRARPGGGAAARSGAAGRAGSARSGCGWPSPRRSSRPRPGGCSSGSARCRPPPPRSSPTRRSGPPSRRRWTRSRTPCPAPRTRRSWPRRCSRWSRRRGPAVGELPWLAELALPDDDGGWAPAGELVLPGSPLAAVLDAGLAGDARPPTSRRRADPDALRAVGVLDSFAARACRRPRRPGRRRRGASGPTRCSTGCRTTPRRRSGRR